LQISGEDPDEYKSTLKGQLRRILEAEREVLGGPPDFVIAYIHTSGAENTGGGFLKSSKKVPPPPSLSKRHSSKRIVSFRDSY
jgi:hypothetical protein